MHANISLEVSEGYTLPLGDEDYSQADHLDATEHSILLNSPSLSSSPPTSLSPVLVLLPLPSAALPVAPLVVPESSATFLTPTRSLSSSAAGSSQSPFADPTPRDVQAELRATVDSLIKRKKEAQRGLIDENHGLREEIAFLRNTLRLSAAEVKDQHSVDSGRAELAAALAQERADRLRSEEKLRAVVDYLAEQVASLTTRRATVEQALLTSENDCETWKDKTSAVVARCELLETENLKVKSLLGVLARQAPWVIQQQVQSMLREVARDRASLKKLEEADRLTESSPIPRSDAKGTTNVRTIFGYRIPR
ncbi:hypothetical protein C8Q78DRAFT_1036203 [Trametes maxima]|nr:hypothetical protein C8Q78DRAFT_1036203 [Trametes maxima]